MKDSKEERAKQNELKRKSLKEQLLIRGVVSTEFDIHYILDSKIGHSDNVQHIASVVKKGLVKDGILPKYSQTVRDRLKRHRTAC